MAPTISSFGAVPVVLAGVSLCLSSSRVGVWGCRPSCCAALPRGRRCGVGLNYQSAQDKWRAAGLS